MFDPAETVRVDRRSPEVWATLIDSLDGRLAATYLLQHGARTHPLNRLVHGCWRFCAICSGPVLHEHAVRGRGIRSWALDPQQQHRARGLPYRDRRAINSRFGRTAEFVLSALRSAERPGRGRIACRAVSLLRMWRLRLSLVLGRGGGRLPVVRLRLHGGPGYRSGRKRRVSSAIAGRDAASPGTPAVDRGSGPRGRDLDARPHARWRVPSGRWRRRRDGDTARRRGHRSERAAIRSGIGRRRHARSDTEPARHGRVPAAHRD